MATYTAGVDSVSIENGSLKQVGLIVLDGEEISADRLSQLDPSRIDAMTVLKGEQAVEHYGEKGAKGVIEITTKKSERRGRRMNIEKFQFISVIVPSGSILQPHLVAGCFYKNRSVLSGTLLFLSPVVANGFFSYHTKRTFVRRVNPLVNPSFFGLDALGCVRHFHQPPLGISLPVVLQMPYVLFSMRTSAISRLRMNFI